MVLRNEMYMIVGRRTCHDIVWASMIEEIISKESEKLEKFIRELRGVANHVNTPPNSLGRLDTHKINFMHRQLHPSVIGQIDLLDSSKDVGQSGMISPWSETSTVYQISDEDRTKYPNIKYDLYKFICDEFPNPAIRFNVNSLEEYTRLLDHLVRFSYIDLDYKVPAEEIE